MIHHELTASTLRIFAQGGYGDDYAAVATLVWLSPTEVEIRAFHGSMSRVLYGELLRWLVEQGIEIVRASRMGRHRLPGAVLDEDGHWRLDVQALARRWPWRKTEKEPTC